MEQGGLRALARKQDRRLRELWLRAARAEVVHCLGDSNTAVFGALHESRVFWRTRFKLCVVNGATATGIANPQSVTHSGPIFERYLGEIPKQDYVLFCLGRADCGFVIWYRSQKYGLAVDEQFDRTLALYFDFIRRVRARGHSKIIVCSVPLPTIKDGEERGVAGLRREVKATLAERTALTLDFNRELRKFAKDEGLLFLDLDPDLYDPGTGRIAERFVNSDPADHHLEGSAFASLVARLMREMGFR